MKYLAYLFFFLVGVLTSVGQHTGKLDLVGEFSWVKKGIIKDSQPLPLKVYKRKALVQSLPKKVEAIKSREISLLGNTARIKLRLPKNKILKFVGEPISYTKKIVAARLRFKDVAEYNLTYTDKAHGFVSDNVVSITEDNHHNIWFATSDRGIVKYDGLNYFSYSDKKGVLSSELTSTHYQADVGLWVASTHGVCLIRNDSVFTPLLPDIISKEINACRISADGKRGVWIATRTHGAFRIEDGRTVQHFDAECGLGTHFILAAHKDTKGNYWFGSNKLIRVDKNLIITEYNIGEETHVENQVLCFEEDDEGLWVGTFSNGVLNIKENQVRQFSLSSKFGGRVFAICAAKGGHWFTFYGEGLAYYAKDKSILITEKNGLCGNAPYALFKDSYNNIWNACLGDGICRLNNSPIFPDPYLPEALGITNSVKVDNLGRFWHFVNGKSMALQLENSIETYTNEAMNPIPSIRHFMDGTFLKDGSFWTAIYAYGIAFCDKKNFTFYQYSNLADDMVVVESELGSDGTVWFNATAFGLIYFKNNKLHRIKPNNNLVGITGLVMDTDENKAVLIGSVDGLQKIIADTVFDFTLKKGTLAFQPTCFFTTSQGQKLIGTAEHGLLLLDNNKLYQLDSIGKKPIETIYSVLMDRNKRIWLKTSQGLTSFILEKGKVSNIYHFGITYSLPMSTLSGGDYLDKQGFAHWSVENGYLSYDFNLANSFDDPPQFTFNGLSINKNKLTKYTSFNLYPDDVLTVYYSLIWHGNESGIRQDYVLINTQNSDTLSFAIPIPGVFALSSLKAGNYKLLLRVKKNNQVYFSHPISLKVLPFWFQSVWFYAIMVALLLVAIIFYFVYKKKLLEKENYKLEMEVAKRTDQIQKEKDDLNAANQLISEQNKEKDAMIQEIHHRVKNNLHFITGLVEMQRTNEKSEEGKRSMEEIERRLQAMSLVHELLYSNTNMHKISAVEYITKLVKFIEVLIGIKVGQIKTNLDIEPINISANSAIYMGMIISELVSNSAKYAFKGTKEPLISISLKQDVQNKQFILKIFDNGTSVPTSDSNKKGIGLRLVDIFSRQLKGTYAIDTTKGYSYTLHFNSEHVE